MSANVMFRSEVLFVVQNNAATDADDDLVSTLMFFDDNELVEAKNALFAVSAATDIPPETLPRLRVRRGDKKLENDASDIIEMWRALDQAKAQLPLFVAADQKRLPPVTVHGSDLGIMSVSMIEMKHQLKEMAVAQKRLADAVACMQVKMLALPDRISASINQTAEFPLLADKVNAVSGESKSKDRSNNNEPVRTKISPNNLSNACESSASVVLKPTDENTWVQLVEAIATAGGIQMPKISDPKPRMPIICGKKEVSTANGPKGVPRRLTAFVGRLHIDTSEESLKEFLTDAGLVNPVCKKLEAKDGRKFRTAAFRVSCDSCCKELFYEESTWPDGCELRDWVFYKREETRSTTA